VHGIAAKIPEEVVVLLDYGDRNPCARQQVTQHHSGRAAANNAACGFERLDGHTL
jgi:hypothetical protein